MLSWMKKRGDNMSHVENYSMADVENILAEHLRELDEERYKNDVNLNLSGFNFYYGLDIEDEETNAKSMAVDFCADVMNFDQRWKEKYGKHILNNNANTMSEWNITYPKRYCHEERYKTKDKDGNEVVKTHWVPNSMSHCKQFFDEVWKFTTERYNNYECEEWEPDGVVDRVRGAYVHMDESCPHMHVTSLCLCKSKNSGNYTFSSSSFLPKKELSAYQKDMERRMREVFKTDDFGLMTEDVFNQPDYTEEQSNDYTHKRENLNNASLKAMTQAEQKKQEYENKIANADMEIEHKAKKKAEKLARKKLTELAKSIKPDIDEKQLDNQSVLQLYNMVIDLKSEQLTLDAKKKAQEEYQDQFQHNEDKLQALEASESVIRENLAEIEAKKQKLDKSIEKVEMALKTANNDKLERMHHFCDIQADIGHPEHWEHLKEIERGTDKAIQLTIDSAKKQKDETPKLQKAKTAEEIRQLPRREKEQPTREIIEIGSQGTGDDYQMF